MSYLDDLRTTKTIINVNMDLGELQKMIDSRKIFDKSYLDSWHADSLHLERQILNYIVNTCQLKVYFEYLTGVSGNSNAVACVHTDGTVSGLFLDEILDLSIMEVFLLVWAVVYKPDYIERYKKKLTVLIRDVLVGRNDSARDKTNIIQEATMPDQAVVQAFDMYWAAWTFVVGHELYHITNREKLTTREEEFRADRFGFQVLIRLIQNQKSGNNPEDIDCFYEEYYLVPCMLMYIFQAMDKYKTEPLGYGRDDYHPSPEERMNVILNLFDTEIPDDMDTRNGNGFLATFLDTFDQMFEANYKE